MKKANIKKEKWSPLEKNYQPNKNLREKLRDLR